MPNSYFRTFLLLLFVFIRSYRKRVIISLSLAKTAVSTIKEVMMRTMEFSFHKVANYSAIFVFLCSVLLLSGTSTVQAENNSVITIIKDKKNTLILAISNKSTPRYMCCQYIGSDWC